MSFNAKQIGELSAKLEKANVKRNPRGFDYVEGWHAIAEANRIFGFSEWDRSLVCMKQLGEPQEIDGKQRVYYMATVRITVRTSESVVIRDGTGYGSGIDKNVGQAHESAIKEAETDAMKRALMTFGNPFGLALYDKDKEGVETAPKLIPTPAPPPPSKTTGEIHNDWPAWIAGFKSDFTAARGYGAALEIWNGASKDLKGLKDYSPSAYSALKLWVTETGGKKPREAA